MVRNLVFSGVVLFLLSSCVANKKYVYMQKDDVNPGKGQLLKDTVVREYVVQPYDYKLQPNDIISIDFQSLSSKDFDFLKSGNQQNGTVPNLSQGNALLVGELVDAQGKIAFPYIGKVKVGGLNIFQVQDTLQNIANQYLDSPVVKARLLNYRITILGEVNQEGSITLYNNRVSILEAVGLAGGLTDFADKANVKLIRQIDGKSEVVYINLLSENFVNSPYYYVHQNDVLIAGALKQRPYHKYFGQNLALLVSSLSLLLLVVGLVNN